MSFVKDNLRAILCCSLLTLSAAAAKADDLAFMGTVDGSFGTVDLNTGAFSLLGNSGQTLAGMAVANATLFATSYHQSTGTLYNVNPGNGALTVIGSNAINIDDFGSTTGGLFAIGSNGNLYSINATTGAASLVGATPFGNSIAFGSWRSLSTNSSTLYFANGTELYTINTSTGAATAVGSLGTAEEGAMVFEDNTLYGGANLPGEDVDTINPMTGAATFEDAVSGTSSSFFALAPNPLPSSTPPSVPEPGSLTLLGSGIFGAAAWLRRRR